MTDTRPMTDDEKQAAILLDRCTFPVASFNKRFARSMASIARSDEPVISERQSRTLWKLFYMFRRQIVRMPELREVAERWRLFKIARAIYDEEQKKEKRPSLDDLQALKEWNEAAK